jgi:uncharacterized membrane protein
MADSTPAPFDLPAHVEESVDSIAALHAEHHENATLLQRVADRGTALMGDGRFLAVGTAVAIGWIDLNLLVPAFGLRPFDPPPFAWLEGLISLASFTMVVLILASQRRADDLAERRAQFTLELAILNERKTAKVIELLEEFRRDDPEVRDRIDAEAEQMARPADPPSVLSAIKQTHAVATNRADGR